MNLFKKLGLERFPKDPFPPEDVWLKRIKSKINGVVRIHKAVLSVTSNELKAAITLEYFTEESHKYKENKHFLKIDLEFLKNFKGNKIITKLLRSALDAVGYNELISIIESCSTFPRVWEFWEKLGAKASHEEGVNRVYLEYCFQGFVIIFHN